MNLNQQTIQQSKSISGVGLHTGKPCTVTFQPAPAHHGIVFKRTDLEGAPEIPALAKYVTVTTRSTTLEANGAKAVTTEHILAAVSSLEIDNLIIEITNDEIPILDGSALPFIETLKSCGIVAQEAARSFYEIKNIARWENAEKGISIIALPHDTFKVTTMVDYNSEVLSPQYAELSDITHFEKEISGARTFVFFHELLMLAKAGLIKGGDVNNAVVLVEKIPTETELAELQKLFPEKEVSLSGTGTLNNTKLRYINEAARHKLLDVVGDLVLVGKPIKGHIIATKPGHWSNTEFAKQLTE